METARTFSRLMALLLSGCLLQAGLSAAAAAGTPAAPLAPATQAGPKPASSIRPALPDLVVSSLGLDPGCRVVLEVRNAGKGPIPEAAFRRGRIRITAGERVVEIALVTPDPKGALRLPDGAVRVPTKLILEKAGKVLAEVDSGGDIRESNEENNRREEALVPRCEAAAAPPGLATVTPKAPRGGVLQKTPPATPEARGLHPAGGTPLKPSSGVARAIPAPLLGGAGVDVKRLAGDIEITLSELHDGAPHMIDGMQVIKAMWRTEAGGPFVFDLVKEDGKTRVATLRTSEPRKESYAPAGTSGPVTYSCTIFLDDALRANAMVVTPAWYRVRVRASIIAGVGPGTAVAVPAGEGGGSSQPQAVTPAAEGGVEAGPPAAVSGDQAPGGLSGGRPVQSGQAAEVGWQHSGFSEKRYFIRGTREVVESLHTPRSGGAAQVRNRWSRRRINIDEDMQPVAWSLIPNDNSLARAGGSFQAYTGATPAIDPKWAGFIFRSQVVFPVEQFRDSGREFINAWIELKEHFRRYGSEGELGGEPCVTAGFEYSTSSGQRVYALTGPWEGNAIDTPGYQIGEIPPTLQVNYSSHTLWDLGDLVRDWISGAKPNHGILIGSRWDTFPEWSCFTSASYYDVTLHLAFKETY